MNTYAELYGNIKKEPIKNGSGNKLISAGIIADNTALSGLTKTMLEGDTMETLKGIHTHPLADVTTNRLHEITSAFENSTLGI